MPTEIVPTCPPLFPAAIPLHLRHKHILIWWTQLRNWSFMNDTKRCKTWAGTDYYTLHGSVCSATWWTWTEKSRAKFFYKTLEFARMKRMILVLLPWSDGTNLSHWSVKKKKTTKNCRFMYMQLHKIHNNRYKRPQASVVARKKCTEKLENIALPSFPTREGHFNVSNIPAQKLCNCANKITNVSFSSPLHKSRHRSNLKVRNIREKFFN